MTILELEKLTGLDRSTIRYYEKEGLIVPTRKENSYRDYSQENAKDLLKIKLLRQLNIPLGDIRQIQHGSSDMSQVLLQRAQELTQDAYYTDRAATICREISQSGASYAQLEPGSYLDRLTASEVPKSPGSPEWNLYPYEFHPIKRFAARIIDYALINILLDFLLIVVFRVRPFTDFMSNLVTYGGLFLSVPLQAFFLNRFATTPGKWLMGIRIIALDGRNLTFDAAMQREWKALRYGHGFGIPLWSLYRHWKSYKTYRDRQLLPQDSGIEHLYDAYEPISKKAFLAGVCVALVALTVFNAMDSVKPRHRGDLTIAQFAENYNFYCHVVNEHQDFPTGKKAMDADGTWHKEDTEIGPNSVVTSTSKGPSVDYVYGLEGERVRSISYTNEWTEIVYWTMPSHLAIACMTVMMSQKDLGFADASRLLRELSEELMNDEGEFSRDNIIIRWNIETVGCVGSGGTYLGQADPQNTSVKLHFEIIIQ